MNEDQDFYGMDRLLQAVRENHDRPVKRLRDAALDDIHAFTQEAALFDDIALVILKREQV